MSSSPPADSSAPTRNWTIIRLPIVMERTGLSRSAVYELISDGAFPQSIKLSRRSIGFLSDEVDEWIEERVKARDAGPQKAKHH